jgi:TfoX/Sxy family transcriptional regulator of competence genes
MAWIKIPKENHPVLLAALPKDPRVRTVQMFGAVAALVNGNMFGGLFARSAIVRLSPADQREALALDGAGPFDPMGNGRVMADTVLLPESVMDDRAELADWLRRAFEFTATLPAKKKKKPAKGTAKAKPVAKRPAAKRKPAKRAGKQPARKRA